MRLKTLLLGLIATLAAQEADAVPFYTTTNTLSALGTIDTVTGATAFIGNVGLSASGQRLYYFTGLAFDTNGKLYGMLDTVAMSPATNAQSQSMLARINPATGQPTIIGNTGIHSHALDLEIGPHGTAYTVGWDNNLYRLNKSTGQATLVGPLGIGLSPSIMDVAFDSHGTLWATDMNMLWTINLNSGAATFQTDILGIPAAPMVMGIAFDADDNLFATTFGGPGGLFEVNTTFADTNFGDATLVSKNVGDHPHGGDVAPVPEPGTLALLSTGLLGLCWVRRPRRAVRMPI